MAKLGDVFTLIRNGASIKQTEGAGGFPITRIETIANRKVDHKKFGYADIVDITKYESYVLQDGDILMSHINSEKHLGKVAGAVKAAGGGNLRNAEAGIGAQHLRPARDAVFEQVLHG